MLPSNKHAILHMHIFAIPTYQLYIDSFCCIFTITLIFLAVMVIGFTQRRQTVSEGYTPPGGDSFSLEINVAPMHFSEVEHRMVYRVLSTGLATVVPYGSVQLNNVDVLFGSVADPIADTLNVGETNISPLVVEILNDLVPEDNECFSIQISPEDVSGSRELFLCDYIDDISHRNFSCEHTVCIEDDDGEFIYIMYSFYILLFLEPFQVQFVETVYTIAESNGSVEVCVNLTQPQVDILDEFVVVKVIDFPSSTYIPVNVTPASE